MKKIEQSASIVNGRFKLHYKAVFDALIYQYFNNCDVTITITKVSKKRSLQQNKYYWSVIVPCIQNGLYETQGEWITKEATHEFLKSNFNYKEIVNKNTGEVVRIPLSTTECDTFNFKEYQDKIRTFADTFLDIIIPLPNEQSLIKL